MSIPRSVADVIQNHVTLEVEGIDRMYLNVYQPKLQTEKQAACFFKFHRKQPVASSALMGVMTNAFLQQVDAFVEQHGIPIVQFRKGQRKDDVAAEHRARFQGTEGVLFLGKAQEKANVFRTEKRTAPNGKKYAWIVKSSVPVNQFYFYCIDEDFGPFFLKFCTYFPYNAKLCINGHEDVKRQLVKEGIAFEPLDKGVLSCANAKRLQETLRSLEEYGKILDPAFGQDIEQLRYRSYTLERALEIAAQARAEGVRSLRDAGLHKVKLGMTSLEEVLAVTNE